MKVGKKKKMKIFIPFSSIHFRKSSYIRFMKNVRNMLRHEKVVVLSTLLLTTK